MSTLSAVLAIIGLALGAVILLVVLALFDRLRAPVSEIDGYADRILVAGLGIARNLDGVDEAVRTRELSTAVPGLAIAYLKKLGVA